VRHFAAEFAAGRATLDVLCNNAGVMAIPQRTLRADRPAARSPPRCAARARRQREQQRAQAGANLLFSQSAAMGALPTLYAATAPDVGGGDYIGPDRFFENRGYPGKARSSPPSHDRDAAARLWEISAALTGVRYDALATYRSD
jgi:NAD(P)-dependent dehydrogenase (short-subunit alcohol dehydrogenase family)